MSECRTIRMVSTAAIVAGLLTTWQPAMAQELGASEDQASTGATPADEPEAADSIVVTGFRSSLGRALEEKRDQVVAVDTILAEDIGKFPDSNLAESMQRLPGVALSRSDGGEGRTITVRGLGAQFTRVRINGMEAASQSGASDANGGTNGGREFAFNVFPS